MFTELIGLLRNLLPSGVDNNKTWFGKIAFLAFLAVIFGGLTYHVMVNTTLGARYGIQLNTELPQLTTMEAVITRRQAWQQISQLRIEDDDVRAVFLLMLIDKKTRNVVQIDTLNSTQTDVVIYDFEFPVQRYGAGLEVVEDVANNLQDEIEPQLRKTQRCLTNEIAGEPLKNLKRGIPEFLATHATVCPLYTFENPRLIGATMAFFRIRPPRDQWYYEDKVRTANKEVSSFFRKFSDKYIYIYE